MYQSQNKNKKILQIHEVLQFLSTNKENVVVVKLLFFLFIKIHFRCWHSITLLLLFLLG